MQNAIKTLRIRNFKSIKDVTIHPRRVNLIIGEPNVGKSNVLEAMSLLGGKFPRPSGRSWEDTGRHRGGLLRYHEVRQLFADNQTKDPILVETDHDTAVIAQDYETGTGFRYFLTDNATWQRLTNDPTFQVGSLGVMPNDHQASRIANLFEEWLSKSNTPLRPQQRRPNYIISQLESNGLNDRTSGASAQGSSPYMRTRPVRPYVFSPPQRIMSEDTMSFLQVPDGSNLVYIIQQYPTLRREIAQLFTRYGLKLLLRVDERRLEIIKDLDGVIYSYPYSSVADTLQRLIFYLAAIESNDDAVILFEEPEAHSYPVYVSQLGRRIAQSRNNQFFVATHSPYLITEVLETMLPDEAQAPELAIFVAYYEDYQTKLRQLTDAEVRGIRADGLDVFYNMDRLVNPEA